MKTKEFISKMNDMTGVRTSITSCGTIEVYNLEGNMIEWVSTDKFGVVVTSYIALDNMKNKEEIVKLMFQYALTPLSEREDEPKFRIKMLPGDNYDCETYLNLNKSDNHIYIDDSIDDIPNNQTIFTKSEYDKLQQKYSEWLPKFDENDPHFEFLEEK